MTEAALATTPELDNVVIDDVTIDVREIEILDGEDTTEVTVTGKGVYLMVNSMVGKTVHLVHEEFGVDGEFIVDACCIADRGETYVSTFQLDK